jgi:hypothetical protein
MKRWRSSGTPGGDKLVIKQCFRWPRPSTLLSPRGGGGAILQQAVCLTGSRPAPQRDINFERNNLEL